MNAFVHLDFGDFGKTNGLPIIPFAIKKNDFNQCPNQKTDMTVFGVWIASRERDYLCGPHNDMYMESHASWTQEGAPMIWLLHAFRLTEERSTCSEGQRRRSVCVQLWELVKGQEKGWESDSLLAMRSSYCRLESSKTHQAAVRQSDAQLSKSL